MEGLAEDAPEHQHPVLLRLQTDAAVGSAVRTGAAWATGSRVASQLLQFVGLVVSARLLMPSDYGNTAVVAPVLAFGYLFAGLGIDSAVIHARRVTEQLLSTVFWINAVAGVLLTAVMAASALPISRLFHNATLAPLLLLASVLFTIDLGVVHLSLLERTLRFRTIAYIETSSVFVSVVTIVVTAAMGAGPYSLVWGPIANQLTLQACLWGVVRWRPHARPSGLVARQVWTYSRGISGFRMLNFWSNNSDNLLLAKVISLTELGNYNRAYNLMRLPVAQMATMMSRVMFPAMSRLRDEPVRLAQAWLKALSIAASLTAPITFGMAVAAPALVEVLFGRRWLGMVTVLELLSISALPLTLSTTAEPVLRALGATSTLFRLGLVTSGMSITAILCGLPWGSVGVATGLLVKFYLEVGVSMHTCLKRLVVGWGDLVRTVRGIWLACVALAIVGLLVRWGLPAHTSAGQMLACQVVACSSTYMAVLWWTDRESVRMMVGLVRGVRTGRHRHAEAV